MLKHGGDFKQAQLADKSAYVISPDEKSTCIVNKEGRADLVDPKVRAEIRKGVSIIKPEWILESIKRGKPLPLIKE